MRLTEKSVQLVMAELLFLCDSYQQGKLENQTKSFLFGRYKDADKVKKLAEAISQESKSLVDADVKATNVGRLIEPFTKDVNGKIKQGDASFASALEGINSFLNGNSNDCYLRNHKRFIDVTGNPKFR